MDYMPFKCPTCGNWHTPIPMPEDMMCKICAEGKHALNGKTGLTDCHWGHMTATLSEVRMTTLWQLVRDTNNKLADAIPAIASAKNNTAMSALLRNAEQMFATMERQMGTLPEILRWAGVKEMPGMADADSTARFKSVEALESLAAGHRRPQTDVDEAKRSIKTCTLLADEVTGMVATVRVALNQVRRAAESWVEPTATSQSMKPAAVRARAQRAKKRELVKV